MLTACDNFKSRAQMRLGDGFSRKSDLLLKETSPRASSVQSKQWRDATAAHAFLIGCTDRRGSFMKFSAEANIAHPYLTRGRYESRT